MSKKEEIIKGARELFRIYGYKKVTMDEIAQKSNVTKKTIYSYFKDKDDLIKYFLNESIDNMKKNIEKIEKENKSYVERIEKIICKLLKHKKEDEIIKKFAEEEENIPLGTAKEYMEILDGSITKEIKRILEKGIELGEVKKCDTDLASFLIYKMYVALMFEWDKPLGIKEVTENIMNILKSGIFE